MQICSKCGVSKPFSSFYKRPETKSGYRKECIECFNIRSSLAWANKPKAERQTINKRVRLKHLYNLTPEAYQEKAIEQENKCFICGTEAGYNNKPLYVDHCHSTGSIRKLLCQHCNSGLGMFKDSPELLDKAADYIRKHNG
jgi:hypothetical protein